jgi:hypothetical protein
VAAAAVAAALKFSQHNMLWGSLPWARVKGVEGLILVLLYFRQVMINILKSSHNIMLCNFHV